MSHAVHLGHAVPLSHNGQEGFSLVETLVAVVVLGVGLVGMIQGITAVLDGTQTAENHSRAVLLAVEQMELVRSDPLLGAGEHEGDFGDDFPGFGWKSVVRESDTPGLFEVVVSVVRAPGAHSLYELVTLVFIPPETEIDPDAEAARPAGEAPGEAARNGRRP